MSKRTCPAHSVAAVVFASGMFLPTVGSSLTVMTAVGVTAGAVVATVSEAEARPRVRDHRSAPNKPPKPPAPGGS